ncbi:hypothetical protein VNO80_35202 [Phaseolus coccineus]|uniref:Ribosomal protein S1 n=1 Tax=Phaseolus coccineus TaxID=3886 RepID=A0AAN9KTG0_PHACN
MMSIYLSRSFPRSNSSLFFCSGKALQSEVLRLGEEMFLVDAGPGTPRICMQDEPTGVPINRATRFENKVGSLDLVAGESLIKKKILERLFIDLVVGESLIKERAAARFNDLVGSTDVVAGEPLLLPRRFRQNLAWMELNKIWRTNTKVKGFILDKVKGGYSVAIAGFITFLPFRSHNKRRRKKISNDRFTIESIHPKSKRTNIVVWERSWSGKAKTAPRIWVARGRLCPDGGALWGRAQPNRDSTPPTSSAPLYRLNHSQSLVGGTGEPRELGTLSLGEGKKGPKHGRCRTLEWQRKGRSYLFFQACSDIWFPRKIKLVSRVMGNLPARFGEHLIRMRGSPPHHCMQGELARLIRKLVRLVIHF